MKTIRIFVVFAAAMFLASVSGFAQGKYGADSANCVANLNFYRDYLKQNSIKDAASLWHKAVATCPEKVSQNLYIHGVTILKYMIDHEQDAARKQVLIDSLKFVYDKRAELYPKYKETSLQNKMLAMATYVPMDDMSAFEENRQIIEMMGNRINPDLLVIQMNRAEALFKAQKMTDEEVLNTYSTLYPVLEAITKADPTDVNKTRLAQFENTFIASGVANCDNLVKVFEPRYVANSNDLGLVKSITGLLSGNECLDTDLFFQTVTKLHELEPSFNSARFLYKLNSSKDNNELALSYLQQAIDSDESEEMEDGDMLLEMATFQFKKMNAYGKAVQTAKLAMEKNPSLKGKANLLIGTIWYQVKCGGDEIAQRAKFWVATDYLQRAKSEDPALAADADELIRSCRVYFPTVEDAFMYNLSDGQSYTISCSGMSATTTVRTNK